MSRRATTVRVFGPYQRGSKWYVIKREPGEPDSRVPFDTEEQARRAIEAARQKLDGVTVANAIAAYVGELERDKRPTNTIVFNRGRLRALLGTEVGPLSQLGPARAVKLFDALCEKTASVATRRQTIRVARRWARWCIARGWLVRDPFLDIKVKGREKRGKKQLHPDEVLRLLSWCLEQRRPGPLAVATIIATGAGAGELVAMTGRDVNAKGWLVFVPGTKTTTRADYAKIPRSLPSLASQLTVAAIEAGADGRLWPVDRRYVGEWVKQACRGAGVPKVCPHSLRGSKGVLELLGGFGADIERASAALRHKSTDTTTDHYLPAAAVEEARSAALDRAIADLDGAN